MKKKSDRDVTYPSVLQTGPVATGFLLENQIQEEVAQGRQQAMATIVEVDSALNLIQSMDAHRLVSLKGLLSHGFTEGRWQTPRKWLPLSCPGELDIDLRSRICWFMEDRHKRLVFEVDEARAHAFDVTEAAAPLPTAASHIHRILDGAVLTLTRYLVLCRLGPSGLGPRYQHRPVDVSFLKGLAHGPLAILMAIAVSKWLDNLSTDLDPSKSETFMGLLQAKDLGRLSANQQRTARTEIKRMKMLSDLDLWPVVGPSDEKLQRVTDPSGASVQPQSARKRDPHLPLPDEYVAEMGRKSLWIIQDLGPNLFMIAAELNVIWQRTRSRKWLRTKDPTRIAKSVCVMQRRNKEVVKFLKGFVWRDVMGAVIGAPPFALRLSVLGEHLVQLANERRTARSADSGEDVETAAAVEAGHVEYLPWPPRNYSQVVGLCAALQRAHLFVVGMAEGPRAGEALTLQRDCVEYAVNGMPYSNGLTFKLTQRFEGESRDWVLPDVAVQAIEQQSRLIRLIENIGRMEPESDDGSELESTHSSGLHLWGQVGGSCGATNAHKPLQAATASLMSYARTLGMDPSPSGQNARFHRFRKTLARIAALALTDSAKILMDVFGHKNIEMTLYYILADKDLQSDIQKVSRELRVMRA